MSDKDGALKVDDVESRLWLQTKTQSGQNWDQVLGVSQRVINKNFEQLFVLYPSMADMYNSNDAGMIDARLLPPKIIIPGGNTSANKSLVYFQLRFESGSMSSSNGNALIEDLSNWVITCEVKIDSKKVVITNAMSDAAKAEAKRQNDWIERFDIAGDYSAERLYAKLSSIQWHQPEPDYTVCGLNKDGKPISYNDWYAEDSNRAMYLNLWLMDWSHKQDAEGRNNIGLSVQVPPVSNTKNPTYQPVFMMNQSYVYKSEKQGALNGDTGDSGAALCNAYLYTEMVNIPGLSDNRRPDDNTLVWSGNFCTLPKTRDESDIIDGTFVFGRNVFLEAFLLPELRAINKAFDIYHYKPYGIPLGDGRIAVAEPWSIGCDENHRDLSDHVYDFRNVNDASDPDKLNGYYYEKVNTQPWTVTPNTSGKAGDMRASSEDRMRIDITWDVGGSVFQVKGHATTHMKAQWTQQGDGRNFNDLFCHAYGDYDITFGFQMAFSTTPGPNGNGVLDVNVVGGSENVKVNIVPTLDNSPGVEDGISGPFKQQLDQNLGQVIPSMIRNLKDKLSGSGQFVFPGNGVFDFVNPMMSRYGHLLAQVKYKPMTVKQLFVPREPKPSKPVVVDPPVVTPVNHSTEPKWQLDWSLPVNPVPSALKKVKVVLRAENKDPTLASQFIHLVINWTSTTKGMALFAEDSWVLAGASSGIPAGTGTGAAGTGAAGTGTAGTGAAGTGTAGTGTAGTGTAGTGTAGTGAADAGTVTRAGVRSSGRGGTGATGTTIATGATDSTGAIGGTGAAGGSTGNVPQSGGVITLRQKHTGKNTAVLQTPIHGGSKWTLNLNPSDSPDPMTVLPGEWLEIEFDGFMGPAGAYNFTVLENWAEKNASYYRNNLSINVTTAS